MLVRTRLLATVTVIALLFTYPPTLFAGDIEEFVCAWLEETSVCSGNQALSDDFLDALVAQVLVDAPGCVLPVAKGRVQVTNNFDTLRVRVQMSGEFANATELSSSCGTGCAEAANDCACSAGSGNSITILPGTTQFVDCAFPECDGCSDSCDNDVGECPSGDIYCMKESRIKIKLKEVSCNAGANWTVLNSSQIVDLSWDLVSPCE